MDISPASAVQVRESGDLIEISDDVLGVARDLRELDPSLRLRYSESHNFWAVYQVEHHPLTQELLRKQLVTTCKDALDPRLVERVRKVMDPNYDLAGELERLEKQSKTDLAHQRREDLGPKAERLAHAMRKDTLRHHRHIFVPDTGAALS